MEKYLLTILLLLVSSICKFGYSQTYGEVSFYLVDSLELSKISEVDSTLIAKCLQQYRTAEDDTSRVNAINKIVEESWNDKVWQYIISGYLTLRKSD